MKVIFQSRGNLFSIPGGDTIQIIKTKEYLEKLGVKVDIPIDLQPDLTKYDIAHIFNLMRPQDIYLQVINAKKQSKKIALSTIYGLYTEYDRKARGGIYQIIANILKPYQIEYLKVFGRGIINKELHKGTIYVILKGYYNTLKKTVKLVDLFLPNSNSEMIRVAEAFNLNDYEYFVIPNAVDINLFDFDNVFIPEELKEYKGCILCVARIEGRKSQLNLVRALKDLKYKLVIIGKHAPNHMNYFKRVRRKAGNNIKFLGYIPHDKLPQFYKLAKVHALPSWMETPGLSSLEAAVMGCNIVITDKGDTKEYFGDYAYYCRPDSVESIRQSIIRAHENQVMPNLREHIKENYNWEKTAKKTLEAYEFLLNKN